MEKNTKQLKYSRQREAIIEFLKLSHDHPSADAVYESVKKEFPNISLGTVYRNLNLLVEIGEAKKIVTDSGAVRYEYKAPPHYHFVCSQCGCVKDLVMDPIVSVETKAQQHTHDTIHGHEINFFGICQDCQEKNS